MVQSLEKVTRIIPDRRDGFMKNICDLIEEYRQNNIQCMMLAFRRKDEESTRTYFIGADDPYLLVTIERLKHDMLGLFPDDVELLTYEK